TFDFLGFTHIAGLSRGGVFQLQRRTSRKKRAAKLLMLREEMRRRRHDPPAVQHRWLSAVIRGHCNYYGVPTNYLALATFRRQVEHAWHRQLQRRSQRARWNVERTKRFEARFPLPAPHIVHPWPDATSLRWPVDRRWEPRAGNPPAGLCPGGGPKGPS